jgi:ring-1,2-phenylacetyl-CoA epoxidase subunit PaaD
MVARARAVLDTVFDPEIPVVTIAELGILRDVRETDDGAVEVVITPTYSGCPAMDQIADDVREALRAAGIQARLRTQLAPAWTTDWMTSAAHDKLRAYGIAPPQHLIATKNIATNVHCMPAKWQKSLKHAVPCPQCQSSNTTEVSHFASTACKALYKCLDCLEPFDYFKPH